jgi:hypothetical protein
MKITLIIPALAATLALAIVSTPITAQAQTAATTPTDAPATSPAPAKAPKAVKTAYKGSITAIDATSVTVAAKDGTLTLAIAATTKIQVNKKAAALTDFAVGDAVTGSYTKDETGAMTAASLRKKTAMPAAAPATTAAPSTTPATQ